MDGVLMDLALRLGRRCGERQDELRAELGLSPAELACLRALPIGRGIPCGELAGCMDLSPSRCTRIIDGLVRRRLVARRSDGADRRRCIVHVTKAGVKIIAQIEDHLAGCERSIREQLSTTDQRKAARGMQLMLEALESRGADATGEPRS